ncbi:phosphatidate cytidylyltransferase [Alkalicella caledoniensis]|uniref:Phosphatidate cytidylyltransferase n=2 Tax=Alkalicella caledoniensis TaxID=2731377 RepID=A0A7G9WCP1_ALKCA|nr:phosphatidate cytidylyltransferase [Alkalicella caledoniensis]
MIESDEMLTRIITALVGIPIVFITVMYGGVAFNTLLFLIMVLGFNEYLKIISIKNVFYNTTSAILALLLIFTELDVFLVILIAGIILSIYIRIMNFKNTQLKELGLLTWGFIYIHGVLYLLKEIRNLENGLILIFLLLLITWVTDSGAYFAGINFGKRKLSPAISPKKSIEGLVGGVLLAIISVLIFNYYFNLGNHITMVIFALSGSVISVFGDLFESSIKREYKIKDSGNILPGHGGILDRIDSLLFLIPLAYVFITYII